MDNFISKLKSLSEQGDEPDSSQPDTYLDTHPDVQSSHIESSDPIAKPIGSTPREPKQREPKPRRSQQRSSKQTDSKRPKEKTSNPLQRLSSSLKLRELTHKLTSFTRISYKDKSIYRYKRFWLGFLGLAAGGGLVWGYWKLDQALPSTGDISQFNRKGTLTIKAADGSILQQQGPATREKLSIQQIPKRLQEAFIAAEDRRFYQHSGVDYQSIVRAVTKNLMARDVVEGGSTITQQLARIVYLNQDQSLKRKVQEAMMAHKISRELPKDKILERYLNLVYLGSGAYGVGDAAWVYFSKPVSQLTLSEMATIAGLPPAPSDYSPLVNQESAKERRGIVLERMAEAGFITEAEAAQAEAEPLELKPSTPKKLYSDTPYFTSYVQQELPSLVSKEKLEEGGLTVETSLNSKWQKAADQVVLNAVKNIGPYEGFKQASLVAIDPKTGEIRAMVGGTDFNQSQFNRATQAQRQPGSSFKTVVYTTAIAAGRSPYDTYEDTTYMVDGYKPKNYSRKHYGVLSMRDAIAQSVNVIAVKVLIDVGFEPTIKMAKAMGIKSKLLPAYSLALGTSEVNLLEMTNVYATLANQGRFIEAHSIRRILDRQGKVIYDAQVKPKQVVDKGTAAIVTWMLQGVVSGGTGRAAALDRPAAGKTGTTEDFRDLWFVGFIPQVAAGVWLGNDDNSPTGSASSTAAEIWRSFMMASTKGMPVEKFPALPKIEGRKGSIKAKPVHPRSVKSGFYDSETEGGTSSSGSSNDSSRSSGSSSSYGSGNYSHSGSSSSDNNYQPPANPSPAEPAPVAPTAPVNEAPPPAEPAPVPAAPAEPPPPPAAP